MLTVGSLAGEMGLELVAGREAADQPIRWVHSTELLDPTPWLSGGELVLTTGIQLKGAREQRQFVRRLADHHLAGIGFGVGFDHKQVPKPLVSEADKLGLPVFEVPYEVPFIAITEKAFGRLVSRQYEVLQRVSATRRRLERLLLDEVGMDELARAVASSIGGAVIVLAPDGEVLASGDFSRPLPDDVLATLRTETAARSGVDAFSPDHPDLAGRALAVPVLANRSSVARAWLVAVVDAEGLGEAERLILEQAATIVGLEMMRRRAMQDTERRLAGDLLAEALSGAVGGEELSARLRPFGVQSPLAVIVLAVPDPDAALADLEDALGAARVASLVAVNGGLLCAVIAAGDGDPLEVAGGVRQAVAKKHDPIRAAASRPADAPDLRRAFHEARCSLEAAAIAANGSAPPDVASFRDAGAFQLLLGLQDNESLRLYCDSVLGPLLEAGGEYGDELLRSLEVFIEQNGQWERAARELYCHRHTLRYRIRKIESLTGRDLGSARDRIEFWLALRGRELIA